MAPAARPFFLSTSTTMVLSRNSTPSLLAWRCTSHLGVELGRRKAPGKPGLERIRGQVAVSIAAERVAP